MSELAMQNHPEPELLAAFVEGKLEKGELSAVTAHLASCGECRAVVAEAAAFEGSKLDSNQPPIEQRAPRRLPKMALRIAIAAAVTAAVITGYPPIRDRYFDPLGKLQFENRPVEARISRFTYAPYEPPMRSAEPSENWRAMAAAADLKERLDKERSARNLHRYALATLALHRTSDAIDLLTEAAAKNPTDVSILSDLGAAQLSAGRVAAGAETSARALTIDPTNKVAAFNWALGLEHLANYPEAIAAWRRYLALDSDSEWAAEARRHLARLETPRRSWSRDRHLLTPQIDEKALARLVRNHPQQVRYHLHDTLLYRWVISHSASDGDLSRRIARLASQRGDTYLLDVVAHASANLHNPLFISGLRYFHQGRIQYLARNYDGAAESFHSASAALASTGSPLRLALGVFRATANFYRGETASALEQIEALAPSVATYASLASASEWTRGLILARMGRQDDALPAYRRGLEIAKAAREHEHELAIEINIAYLLREATSAEADSHRLELMRRLYDLGASEDRLYGMFADGVFASLAAQQTSVARAYLNTQQYIAERANDPLLRAESLLEQAVLSHARGDTEGARRNVMRASINASRVKTLGMRDRVESEIAYLTGTLLFRKDHSRAVAALTEALNTWKSRGWRYHSSYAHQALAELLLERGSKFDAEQHLLLAIDDAEAQRGFDEPALRVAYFTTAERAFDRLIELLISEGRVVQALEICERKRARMLLDMLASAGDSRLLETRPLSSSALRRRLPPDAAFLEYLVLDDETFVWLVSPSSIAFDRIPVQRTALTALVRTHREQLRTSDAASYTTGRTLYDLLIRPLTTSTARPRRLLIATDGPLHDLSFAALVTPSRDYLIQHSAITYTPSLSVACLVGPSRKPANALVVAQSAPTGLPPLPGVLSETARIALLYDRATLINSPTSPRSVLTLAAQSQLIHFSGHAVSSERTGSQSLVLESAAGGLASLDGDIIATARFSARPIVVLAACSTTSGRNIASEGVTSLATAFLSRGATSVIATQTDIQSDSQSPLFVSLHRQLALGREPGAALQYAQLEAIRNGRSMDWSAVVCFAGI